MNLQLGVIMLYILLYLLIGIAVFLRLEHSVMGHHDCIFNDDELSGNLQMVIFWPALLCLGIWLWLWAWYEGEEE